MLILTCKEAPKLNGRYLNQTNRIVIDLGALRDGFPQGMPEIILVSVQEICRGNNQVRLGFEAADEITIDREPVYRAKHEISPTAKVSLASY